MVDRQSEETVTVLMMWLERDGPGAGGHDSRKLIFLLIATTKYLVCRP